MSTLVIQERHLWLNLVEKREAKKVHFLDAPISKVGLISDTMEEFAQQLSTVKKQTNTSCLGTGQVLLLHPESAVLVCSSPGMAPCEDCPATTSAFSQA